MTYSTFSICEENNRIKWVELVPKFAYSFIPEDGVPDEMWEDDIFLKKVEKAGLLINEKIKN